MTGFVGLALSLAVSTAAPAHASAPNNTNYDTMSDAALTEVLQEWGTLASADRRGLLVELKKRMQRPDNQSRQLVTTRSSENSLRPARITIRIRVRQNMRYGAGIGNQPTGMFVVRSGARNSGIGEPAAAPTGPAAGIHAMRHLLAQMRARMARAEPLPGPGFGDGFERRQDYLQASVSGSSGDEVSR